MSKESELIQAIQIGNKEKINRMLDEFPELVNARAGHEVPMALMALYYQQEEIAEIFAGRGAILDIFAACGLGKVERVRELLAEDPACANKVAGDGFQPLGLAAFFGRDEVARVLIEHGADVNSPSHNPMQVMPLHSAAAGGHLELVRVLLEAGAQPNARQSDEFTPIHAAAQNGDVEMIRLLIHYGADPTLTTGDGRGVLDFAKESGNPQAAAEFLRR